MSEISSRVMTHVDQALAGLQNELDFVGMESDASQVYLVRQQLKVGEINRQHNEIIHLQVQLRQTLNALETAQAAIARAREEALLEVCRVVCVDCDAGEIPFTRSLEFWKYWHTTGRQCLAGRVRELMAKETAADQGGQEGESE